MHHGAVEPGGLGGCGLIVEEVYRICAELETAAFADIRLLISRLRIERNRRIAGDDFGHS